ncbi:non-ribosomal peptide synthetase [Brevibacillus brevis]|uniref:Amino acid adenylation domain-containing protein n=1 Tax=Brevibacillus brevis TaxID=1393 RepID=A0A517I1Q4_BREBE|nr:non-ribosomal peptide synthetase [Brevibacillus brevis]QDS32833.1 amino acid adenylation domain-containing protein [Brevibacillus brevis]
MPQNLKTNSVELLMRLRREGIFLWEENGSLRYRAPRGTLAADDLQALKEQKADILALLRADSQPVTVVPDPAARFVPFPLTDVQSAYLLGRYELFGYGGVACHIYMELDYPELDPKRAEDAWNLLIARHDMLRATIDQNGQQRILEKVPHLAITYTDTSGMDEQEAGRRLDDIREAMGHRVYDTAKWPLFDIGLTKTSDRAVLHVSMEFLIADWASIWLLLGEFEALYKDPGKTLPALPITFRDYVFAERSLRETTAYGRDKAYWQQRIDALPQAPDLPMARQQTQNGDARFRRRFIRLHNASWDAFKQRAQQRGLTPTSAVMTAFAAVIERWSRNRAFCLNLTLLNRQPLHERVHEIVGDFTSVNLLAVDWGLERSFQGRAKTIQKQLFEDLDHRLFSGVEVMRELARRRGREAALMPIVFTSAIGLVEPVEGGQLQGKIAGHGISQTPQVFIDCQAMDSSAGLQVNWDVREGVFPEHVVDDMFDTFAKLLQSLADSEQVWEGADVMALPDWQREERQQVNATTASLPEYALHQPIVAQAMSTPDRPAVIDSEGQISYAELVKRAAAVAGKLKEQGCREQDRVAIVMEKGANQVTAVLGTFFAGGVYVPIDPKQPEMRRQAMMEQADIRYALTVSTNQLQWSDSIQTIAVDQVSPQHEPLILPDLNPDLPAYIIYTSGSTGQPKGVVISHRAAANTIEEMLRRFVITEKDRVLGLAQLSFDLSVYDIFATLSVGGAVVYPHPDRQTDPSHWSELIVGYDITVWNSVPALMQMLVTYLDSTPTIKVDSLRLALLSGDWIPLTLPDRMQKYLPAAQIVSLGGATEASIWSNYHLYNGLEADWNSIPYGRPLANQGFRVLDSQMRDCPVWVIGDLYITGAGLAEGYVGDQRLTEERFFSHPVDGERLYRTGDLGRYTPGGEIEFIGREDNQVKIRGHRIELGEIETALLKHPAVAAAGVVLDGASDEPVLLGIVESARKMDRDLEAERAEFALLVNGIGEEADIEVNQRIVMLLQQIARQHTSMPLRVLQVGAGNGALTEHVSQALEGYDVAYISMDTVEEEYRVQGLAPNSFDVVFTDGAIDSSYMNKLKELICPGGWLILTKWTEASWISELQNEEDSLVFVLQKDGENRLLAHRVKLDRVNVSAAELEKFLSLHLPTYMLPAHLQVVDALPLTGNGKIDRRELAKWRSASSVGQSVSMDATEGTESDPLEAQLAHVWAEALGVSRIGRTQSFYEYGADSLIMAQVAGKLRDKLAEDPTHAAIPFDVLLRQMLNFPTVEALAGFIHMRNQEMQQSEEVALPKKRNKSSNAVLIPYGGDESGPLRVVFHAVLGTMDSFRPLIEQLKAQQTGSIVGIAIDDSERYCALEPSELIETVADDYAECLIDVLREGEQRPVQLIGYSLGGLIAIEVARRLGEQGVPILDLVLIDIPPILTEVNDDLLIEALFVPNLNITLEQADFGKVVEHDFARAILQLVEKHGDCIPQGSACTISGDEGLDQVGEMFRKLSAFDRRERFTAYVHALGKTSGEQMPVEMAEGLCKVFGQSFKAARYTPLPYMGDIRFLLAREPFQFLPSTSEETIAFWQDICIGELEVTEIAGNHYSCIVGENVVKLAELLAVPLGTK